MRLFSRFLERVEYKAALNVLMASYTYDRLSADEQKKVDEHAIALMHMAGSQAPNLDLYALPEDQYCGIIAWAMRELSLKPHFAGESWRYLGNPFLKDGVSEDAIDEAAEYIKKKHGIDLFAEEDQEPPSEYELASMIATTIEALVNQTSDENVKLGEYYVVITESYRVSINLDPRTAIEPVKCAVNLGQIAKDEARRIPRMDNPLLRKMAIDQLSTRVLVSMRGEFKE